MSSTPSQREIFLEGVVRELVTSVRMLVDNNRLTRTALQAAMQQNEMLRENSALQDILIEKLERIAKGHEDTISELMMVKNLADLELELNKNKAEGTGAEKA